VGLDNGDINVYQNSHDYELLEIFTGHSDRVNQIVFADA
jgi:hypothetical protein